MNINGGTIRQWLHHVTHGTWRVPYTMWIMYRLGGKNLPNLPNDAQQVGPSNYTIMNMGRRACTGAPSRRNRLRRDRNGLQPLGPAAMGLELRREERLARNCIRRDRSPVTWGQRVLVEIFVDEGPS